MENQYTVSCCICGGGPAGMMLGYLLARAGVTLIVLEKHKDFFRDFRGDTLHPSTFQLMDELGLLRSFLKVYHQELQQLKAVYNGKEVTIADFSHLKVAKPILGLMAQWDFLNFLAEKSAPYPGFQLLREAEVTGLIVENGSVQGVKAKRPGGEVEIRAGLVVGTDGRSSIVRKLSNLPVINTGAPIDVLWFRLSRKVGDPGQAFGCFDKGRIMILIDRGDYWQCAYIIVKEGFQEIQARGMEGFHRELAEVAPFIQDRVSELAGWGMISLLSVSIDYLEQWYAEGLLCIGDAAHSMSPIGGVGINLAIQDAVATANILYRPLLEKRKITLSMLKKIQDRRAFPARIVQKMQVFIQNGIMQRKTNIRLQKRLPLFLRLLKRFPILRRIPARFVGMGIRPEHIRFPHGDPK